MLNARERWDVKDMLLDLISQTLSIFLLVLCESVLFVVFICWVDYALEGSVFILSKCDFSRMFHTERS